MPQIFCGSRSFSGNDQLCCVSVLASMGRLFFYFCLRHGIYYSRYVALYPGHCCCCGGVYGNSRSCTAAEKQPQHCACRVAEATAKSEVYKPIAASVGSNLRACLSRTGRKVSQASLNVVQSLSLTITARLVVMQKSKQLCTALDVQHTSHNRIQTFAGSVSYSSCLTPATVGCLLAIAHLEQCYPPCLCFH